MFVSDTNNARVIELSPSTAAGTPSLISGSSPVNVKATLTGLTPGTVYYYRVATFSAGGTVVANGQFTTPAATLGVITPDLSMFVNGPNVEGIDQQVLVGQANKRGIDGLLG